ncbi:MAG TPA: tetratricopeptide repeat protein [Blastocatellia bacterium]
MAKKRPQGTAAEHCRLGMFLYGKGSYDLAIEQFQLALRRAPHAANVWSNLGAAYIDKKDFTKARQALEHALALKPDYGAALFHLGQLYDEIGEAQKAEECFRRVMTIEPHTYRGWRAKERALGIKPRVVMVDTGDAHH